MVIRAICEVLDRGAGAGLGWTQVPPSWHGGRLSKPSAGPCRGQATVRVLRAGIHHRVRAAAWEGRAGGPAPGLQSSRWDSASAGFWHSP